MSSAKLISLLKSKPFRPFRMKLTDGRGFVVDYKRQVAMMDGDTTCIFLEQHSDDSCFTIIDLAAIATIQVKKLPRQIQKHFERYND